jgi:hypothetical protein
MKDAELTAIDRRLGRWATADKDSVRLGFPRETVLSRMSRHGTPIQGTRRPHFEELLDYDAEVEETEQAVSNLPRLLQDPIKMYYLGYIDSTKPRLRVTCNQAKELGLPVRAYYELLEKAKIWLWGWFQARRSTELKNCAHTSIQ